LNKSTKTPFFRNFFGENIFKIITSVPDVATHDLLHSYLRDCPGGVTQWTSHPPQE
jgi:hypothetical protein